jgi:hypothetical protein
MPGSTGLLRTADVADEAARWAHVRRTFYDIHVAQ